jgi:hypothetical protein
MRGRGLKSKSEAIRVAVREAAAPFRAARARDFSALIGFVDRLPGKRTSGKTAAELLCEIDREMGAKLRWLGSRRSSSRSPWSIRRSTGS